MFYKKVFFFKLLLSSLFSWDDSFVTISWFSNTVYGGYFFCCVQIIVLISFHKLYYIRCMFLGFFKYRKLLVLYKFIFLLTLKFDILPLIKPLSQKTIPLIKPLSQKTIPLIKPDSTSIETVKYYQILNCYKSEATPLIRKLLLPRYSWNIAKVGIKYQSITFITVGVVL